MVDDSQVDSRADLTEKQVDFVSGVRVAGVATVRIAPPCTMINGGHYRMHHPLFRATESGENL